MNEVSKSLVCVVVRGGIEIWLEDDKATQLKTALESQSCPQFLRFNGQFLNKSDITGIFDALMMEEKTRIKNGQWKCAGGSWHERFKRCESVGRCYLNNSIEYQALLEEFNETRRGCVTCKGLGCFYETKEVDSLEWCSCSKFPERKGRPDFYRIGERVHDENCPICKGTGRVEKRMKETSIVHCTHSDEIKDKLQKIQSKIDSIVEVATALNKFHEKEVTAGGITIAG